MFDQKTKHDKGSLLICLKQTVSLLLLFSLMSCALVACKESLPTGNTAQTTIGSAESVEIALQPNALTLIIGEQFQLTVTPENTADPLTWISSDPTVAKVQDGLVSAKKEGQAIITVKCGEKEAHCSVNVSKKTNTGDAVISYAEIVERLYSEEWKAQKSNMGETTYQWSTTDPSSVYNEETGLYEAWDANGDGWVKFRDENNNSLTIDIKGSGYVSRIWFAQIYRGGTITIEVDGQKVVESDLLEYMIGEKSTMYDSDGAIWDSVCGAFRSNHTYGELSYASSKGYNSFIPITFSESIRIYFANNTASSDYDAASFKQISYTLFDDKRTVESFTGLDNMSAENKAALEKANQALNFILDKNSTSYTVAAGSETEVYSDSKPGAISLVTLTLPNTSADRLQETLRYTYIKAYWDGMATPAIDMSLGDFFGSPAQVVPYRTWNLGVTADNQLYARFYMPYASAKIVVGNLMSQNVTVQIDFETQEITKADADGAMRFCASWQRCADRSVSDDRWPDAATLMLIGSGRLVGQYWHTYQVFEGFWWGEGDERIFVDGEKMPSWAGTGAEDIIGYAYSIPYSWPFSSMFRAHPVGAEDSGAVGDKINIWMLGNDALAFDSSLEMSLEKYFSDEYCYLSAVSYYYLNPEDIEANYKGTYDVAARNACAPLHILDVYPSLYRYEGEFLRGVSTISRGTTYRQELGLNWSGRTQICWFNCGNGGDRASLSVPISVDSNGKYNISFGFTVAIDFVMVDVYLDDQKIGQTVNLYNPVLGTKFVDFGWFDLDAGIHTIKFVVVGVDSRAGTNNGNYVFGLDYIDVRPENWTRIEASDILNLNLKTTGGEIRQETRDNGSPSNTSYLTFLNPAGPNGQVSFDVNIQEDGSYTLEMSFVKAFDFPIVTVYLDGQQVGDPVDLYHGGLKATGNIDFGTMDLTAGTHTITVKTLSKNPASAGYVFSIDHVDIIRND